MKLTFAYSPCPNDTFMFEPIVSGRIDTEGLRFEIHLADVEELNKSADAEKYDITKLSFNAYTHLTEQYQLLTSGSALGRNCGPLLIANHPIEQSVLGSKKIAIPGENTTANFLLSFAFPDINQKEETLFSDIEQNIVSNKVDAGVIIHENRFTYQEKGLVKIQDLGEYWEEKTGFPIPLGGIVTRRRFTEDLKQKINRVIARSVEYALANPDSGLEYIKQHAQEMDEHVMRSHINLYVNEYSADIGKDGRNSIQYLFDHHPNTSGGEYTTPLFVEPSIENNSSDFLSGSYWSSRYKNEMTGWDIGQPSPPLQTYIDQISDKSIKILIPGAGNAHEAEYLHDQGFSNVYVCDIAEEALNNLKERCPTFPVDNLIHGDFFEIEVKFDLILEQTFFCALHPSKRKEYVQKMASLLNPKGKLVGVLFGIEFPFTGPPFGGKTEEYSLLFLEYLNIISMETCHNSIGPRAGNELFFIADKKSL